MNPAMLFKLLEVKSHFTSAHPKVIAFFQTVTKSSIEDGTVIEISVTPPGKDSVSCNMKLTQKDIDILRELKELQSK